MNKSVTADHSGPRLNTNSKNNVLLSAKRSEEESAFYSPIGARIKNLRVSQGITQAELAKRLNINMTRLGHMENGYAKINLQEFCMIAKALSTTPAILLGDSEVPADISSRTSDTYNDLMTMNDTVSGLLARLRTLSRDDPAILGTIVQLLENCRKI